MRILVTGAAGFIGRHLLASLSSHYQVFALVRHPYHGECDERVSFIKADLRRLSERTAWPDRVDVIIHLAQANVSCPDAAHELFLVNTISALHLLEYGRRAGVKRFILASTGDVYGHRRGRCRESDAVAPASLYATTKCAAEMLVQAFSEYLQPSILRLFQPYGPGQTGRLIPKLAERIRQKMPIRLGKDDCPHVTPVFVNDVVSAFERAIDAPYWGTFNIAGDAALSMRELAREIGRIANCEPVFDETNEELGDMMGDNAQMKRVLGTWPMVSLSDGLYRTLRAKKGV